MPSLDEPRSAQRSWVGSADPSLTRTIDQLVHPTARHSTSHPARRGDADGDTTRDGTEPGSCPQERCVSTDPIRFRFEAGPETGSGPVAEPIAQTSQCPLCGLLQSDVWGVGPPDVGI